MRNQNIEIIGQYMLIILQESVSLEVTILSVLERSSREMKTQVFKVGSHLRSQSPDQKAQPPPPASYLHAAENVRIKHLQNTPGL